MPDGLYTMAEAAEYLGLAPSSVPTLRGHGRFIKEDGYIGRTPYWHQGTLDTYRRMHPAKPRPAPAKVRKRTA